MAQQVKFHSVTAEKYGEIASPDAGSLYFISDNGEIRKGSQHITGTRVYTAVDPTNGATPLNELTILLNDNVPGANDQPKKGDILIVDQTLRAGVAAQGTEGEEGYVPAVPAVVAKAAYAHNGEDWEACDGNVDASKVILTQDYTLAGDYDKVGNLTKGSDYKASGKSVADALRDIFTKELDNSTKTDPSFSLTGGNESLEVGSTKAAATYTATWSDGSYGNKAYWGANDLRTETGTTVGTWTISAYNGKTASNATIEGNTASITTDAFTVTTTGDTQMVSFSVTNNLTNTKKAATNLGNEGTVKITASSISAQTRKVTGFRYWFYGSNTTAKDYTSVDDSGNATVAVNDNIRALTKVTSLTSMNVVQNATQVVIAIPSNKTLNKVTDGGALNAEITGNFIEHSVKVGGADSVAGTSIGSYPGNYKVYVMTPSAPLDARTYTIKIV